jgi:hypothetical protein
VPTERRAQLRRARVGERMRALLGKGLEIGRQHQAARVEEPVVRAAKRDDAVAMGAAAESLGHQVRRIHR